MKIVLVGGHIKMTNTKICPICNERIADTRHAKNYNHNDLRPQNNIFLDEFCHTALHLLNQNNEFDWDFMFKNRKKEIKRMARVLIKKRLRKI